MSIQQAINQGLNMTSALGQLSGVPGLKLSAKMQKNIADETLGQTPTGEYRISEKKYKEMMPAIQSYIETNKQLYEKTGNKRFLNEWLETSQDIADYANSRAQSQLANKQAQKSRRRSLLDTPISIRNESFGTVGELPEDMQRQIEGELRNGRK